MDEILKFIFKTLTENGLNYHFQRYDTAKVVYPYHIGALLPVMPMTEDGKKEFTMTVDSFHRGSMYDLLKEVEKIDELFPSVEGRQTVTDNRFVVVYSGTSQPIETGEAELKRIQTDLIIKTWKGKN